MTSNRTNPVFATNPNDIRFEYPCEKIPRYTDHPCGVYRLLVDKTEEHIILQAKLARKIDFSRDNNLWKTTESVLPQALLNVIETSKLLPNSVRLGRTVHRSEESDWETIYSWSDWEAISLLSAAKTVIAEDQKKLESDYLTENARRERRAKMYAAITY